MSVSLIENPSEAAATDSTATEQPSITGVDAAARDGSGGDRRELFTLHIGSGWTIVDEDLELLLLVVQTLLLVAWAYSEVTN